MTDYTDDYSGRPQYYLRLRITGDAVAGVSWWLDAVSKSGYGSWTAETGPWAVAIGGRNWSGSAALDFRPDSAGKVIRLGLGSFSPTSSGSPVSVSGSHGPISLFGSASKSGSFTILGKPPAPSMMYIDQITATSMRFDFDNNGDGGSPVTRWEYQYATNSSFTGATLKTTSSGTNTITGLTPGTRYWIRARGVNALGAGDWSSSMNATTLSGVQVSTGSAWGSGIVHVSTGSAWGAAVVNVSNGSAWIPAQ